jgi:L-fucose mutarotase
LPSGAAPKPSLVNRIVAPDGAVNVVVFTLALFFCRRYHPHSAGRSQAPSAQAAHIRTPPGTETERSHMLKNIDPLLNADVLYALRAMGHGDELVISDTNFPSDSVARDTKFGRLLSIANVTAADAIRAVLSVMPLDSFVDHPALRMEIVGKPKEIPEVQREVQKVINKAEGKTLTMGRIERMAFYERARRAYCVITTGERRFYGCFILKKGVIGPDA